MHSFLTLRALFLPPFLPLAPASHCSLQIPYLSSKVYIYSAPTSPFPFIFTLVSCLHSCFSPSSHLSPSLAVFHIYHPLSHHKVEPGTYSIFHLLYICFHSMTSLYYYCDIYLLLSLKPAFLYLFVDFKFTSTRPATQIKYHIICNGLNHWSETFYIKAT